jgi:hypothetical protein
MIPMIPMDDSNDSNCDSNNSNHQIITCLYKMKAVILQRIPDGIRCFFIKKEERIAGEFKYIKIMFRYD